VNRLAVLCRHHPVPILINEFAIARVAKNWPFFCEYPSGHHSIRANGKKRSHCHLKADKCCLREEVLSSATGFKILVRLLQ